MEREAKNLRQINVKRKFFIRADTSSAFPSDTFSFIPKIYFRRTRFSFLPSIIEHPRQSDTYDVVQRASYNDFTREPDTILSR